MPGSRHSAGKRLGKGDHPQTRSIEWGIRRVLTLTTVGASAVYLAVLFGLARMGETARRIWFDPVSGPPVYALTLAIYCTGWTFYGAVGAAAAGGWTYLPIYLGPILALIFARPVLGKAIRVGRLTATGSIADFIAARYGKSARLAALVTLLAVAAGIPYIALQLRALAASAAVMFSGPSSDPPGFSGFVMSGVIALLMAVMVMQFGVSKPRSTDRHSGLMLAVSLESIVKLAAFLMLAIALASMSGLGGSPSLTRFVEHAGAQETPPAIWWIATTLLSALAVLCLPRQFHVAVVEGANEDHLRTAAWIFPLYLALFAIAIPSVAITGIEQASHLPGDTLVVSVPLLLEREGLAVFVFLGGLAAATGMMIVAGLALATMVTNDLVLPIVLRRTSTTGGLGRRLIHIRRLMVAVLFAAAWGFDFALGEGVPLAAIGLLAFAGVAQFAIPLIGGLYWRRGHEWGAMAGIIAGGAVWLVALVGPVFASDAVGGVDTSSASFAIAALASLGINCLAYLIGSLLAVPGVLDEAQADLFVGAFRLAPPTSALGSEAERAELEHLVGEVLGPAGVASFRRSIRDDPSPEVMLQHVEQLLAATVGAAAARVLLARSVPISRLSSHDARAMLGDATTALATQLAQLRLTVETVTLGLAMIGADHRITLANRRFVASLGGDAAQAISGLPLERMVETARIRHGLDLAKILTPPTSGTARREVGLSDGRTLDIAVTPLPDGGRVVTIEDVTERLRNRQLLERSKEDLERRVIERTSDLESARAVAEAANAAKGRFLAACGHDLMQPLAAARLFTARLAEDTDVGGEQKEAVGRVETALMSLEDMVTPLLDIARLDRGGARPERQAVAIDQVLSPLAAEGRALAEARGLTFRYRGDDAVVETDPHWLRRILQNFLTNALRYTESGGVLLASRRRSHPTLGSVLRVAVWDTGPGIDPDKQAMIFEEFRRLSPDSQGLGLGLAIVERSASMLGHPLVVHSRPGHGSQFAVDVPLTTAPAAPAAQPVASQIDDDFEGLRVTVVDDDDGVRTGMAHLLSGWGMQVTDYADPGLVPRGPEHQPDLIIVDYRMGSDRDDGLTLLADLRRHWGAEVPAVLVTAEPADTVADRASAMGVDFLSKPLKPARLRALLNRRLPSHPASDPPHSSPGPTETAAQ